MELLSCFFSYLGNVEADFVPVVVPWWLLRAAPTSMALLSFSKYQLVPSSRARLALPVATFCMGVKAAGAATMQHKPQRVQQILSYLEQHGHEHGLAVTSIPMEYTAQPAAPLPPIAAGLSPADVLSEVSASATTAAEPPDEASVIAALLYLALGGVDQAHNLVTPLCWGAPTNYGGRPKTGSPAAQDAAYVHALVHRAEGACDGEFGSGFSNAQYWYRAAGQHAIAPDVLAAAQTAAKGSERLEGLVAKHGHAWSPGRFVGLCEEANGRRGDAELRGFCDEVIRAEWHLLLEHCYQRL